MRSYSSGVSPCCATTSPVKDRVSGLNRTSQVSRAQGFAPQALRRARRKAQQATFNAFCAEPRAGCLENAVDTDSKITRPSMPPSSGSHARSGWGIMPTTLRDSLHTEAIALIDPLGFHELVEESFLDGARDDPELVEGSSAMRPAGSA